MVSIVFFYWSLCGPCYRNNVAILSIPNPFFSGCGTLYCLKEIKFSFVLALSIGCSDQQSWNFSAIIPEGHFSCVESNAAVTRAFQGVDITKLDLIPLDFTEDDGFRGPVLEMTCRKMYTWQLSEENENYFQLPDQIETLNVASEQAFEITADAYKSVRELKEKLSQQVGLSYRNGMFSNSGIFQRANQVFSEAPYVISDVMSITYKTEARIETLKPNKYVRKYIDMLPKTYEDDPFKYESFIETFGTHFFEMVSIGSVIRNQTTVKRDFYSDQQEKTLKFESTNNLLNWLKNKDDQNKSNNPWKNVFGRISQVMSYNRDLSNTWSKKHENKKSLYNERLIIYQGKMNPISDLIEDNEKRDSMIEAVQQYLNKVFLSEMEFKLNKTLTTLEVKSQFSVLQKLAAEIRNLTQIKFPSVDYINSLASDLVYQLETPDWWHKTSLCFKYLPDAKKSCLGPSPQCALVNQATDVFEDWSGNLGGCQLSWGIFNNDYVPDSAYRWLKNVKLCFKYVPVGDSAQCGNGTRNEICAPINEYLPYYHDQTDTRKGGCDLAWKLSVINSEYVPTWFITTKFCYFVLTLKSVQNDSGDFVTQCATVNNYTPFLKDYTYTTFMLFRYKANYLQWAVHDADVII